MLFCILQVHGCAGMPDFQRTIDNRRVFRIRKRNIILDGTYLVKIF